MISNPDRTVLLSSLGWVDRDALWCFHVPQARSEPIPLGSGASWASLHSSGSDYFSVGHHFDGARFDLTVSGFSDPGRVLARATVGEGGTAATGDPSIWSGVPRLYVDYLKFEPWKDFVLLKVGPAGKLDIQRLEWYDDTYESTDNSWEQARSRWPSTW